MLIRIYCSQQLVPDAEIFLDQSASAHVCQVLRLGVGDTFHIFNGQGGEYEATVIEPSKKSAHIKIGAYIASDNESPCHIHLGQAISRGDRMDYAIVKAVELGVSEITPILSARCVVRLTAERKLKRQAHWQALVRAAAEQSGRTILPVVHEPMSLAQWLLLPHALGVVALPKTKMLLGSLMQSCVSSISLLIGPESGFSSDECDLMLKHHFHAFNMGPRILRTETATVVAITLIQSLWGDLGF